MSRTYEILEQIDWASLSQKANNYYAQYKKGYAKNPKKADVFGEKLLIEIKRVKPSAIKTPSTSPKTSPKSRRGLTPIQQAGRDLRLRKSSRAGTILAKANTKATRDLNNKIALQRLKEKGFAGMCGFGSNQVML